MNEDQPNFKVTDRRLFNADGSPRDLPPEEKSETTATAAEPVAPAAEAQTQPEIDTQPAPAEMAEEPGNVGGEEGDGGEPVMGDQDLTEDELAEARNPASFISFVMSIASNAASALGMMEHPVTHQREVDPELGKHWIEILGMLQKKTSGNLTLAERNMLEGLLHDLRMQYVALINAPQKARGFTGSDITGGR
ncbi:MAG TPA: DUF1844 domain-containing protein [Pyrinomonadaceae bacterium]|nr:DUF1844 domain-containing protein [Pyrinomonadaceae bacterium]